MISSICEKILLYKQQQQKFENIPTDRFGQSDSWVFGNLKVDLLFSQAHHREGSNRLEINVEENCVHFFCFNLQHLNSQFSSGDEDVMQSPFCIIYDEFFENTSDNVFACSKLQSPLLKKITSVRRMKENSLQKTSRKKCHNPKMKIYSRKTW